ADVAGGERAAHRREALGPRPRSRVAGGGGAAEGGEPGPPAARLPPRVDRLVREPATGRAPAGGGRPAHAAGDLLPALHGVRLGPLRAAQPAERALRPDPRNPRLGPRGAAPV